MSGIIDTNILLYAVNLDCPEHSAAREFLAAPDLLHGPCYITVGICYEFLRVATHPRVFATPITAAQALDFLESLVGDGRIHLLHPAEQHWKSLRAVVSALVHPAGNLFFDIRTAALMRDSGIRTIHTADRDFLQFPGIEVIDPVHPAARGS